MPYHHHSPSAVRAFSAHVRGACVARVRGACVPVHRHPLTVCAMSGACHTIIVLVRCAHFLHMRAASATTTHTRIRLGFAGQSSGTTLFGHGAPPRRPQYIVKYIGFDARWKTAMQERNRTTQELGFDYWYDATARRKGSSATDRNHSLNTPF